MQRPDSLVFEWPGRHHIHFALPVAVVLAACLHAGIFFVFSIVYPPTTQQGPTSAKVFFIPPRSQEAAALAGLLASEDPAVYAPGRGLFQPNVPTAGIYNPQYEADKPVLAPLPEIKPAISPPVNTAGGAVVISVSKALETAGPKAVQARLVSSGPLAARLPSLPEKGTPELAGGLSLEPPSFVVGVGADGTLAHIFPLRSSGNPYADGHIFQMVRSLRFQPAASDGPVVWGVVEFHWGSIVP